MCGTLDKHLIWHRNLRERIICLKGLICHDICKYCLLSDILITITYPTWWRAITNYFKNSAFQSFKIKGFQWYSQDRESTCFGKELALDVGKIGHGKDHTTTLPPSLHLTTKGTRHIMGMAGVGWSPASLNHLLPLYICLCTSNVLCPKSRRQFTELRQLPWNLCDFICLTWILSHWSLLFALFIHTIWVCAYLQFNWIM